MVYSPDHAGSAIWQVYLQGKKYEMTFPNIELQIWRKITDQGATNILQTVKVGTSIDACTGGLDGAINSEQVDKGSTDINVRKAADASGTFQKFS